MARGNYLRSSGISDNLSDIANLGIELKPMKNNATEVSVVITPNKPLVPCVEPMALTKPVMSKSALKTKKTCLKCLYALLAILYVTLFLYFNIGIYFL